MTTALAALAARLAAIPTIRVSRDEPLARHTRFALGGPADLFAETASPAAFVSALRVARESGVPWFVIGGGTNLIAADAGFRGVVLCFSDASLGAEDTRVTAGAGAVLQGLIDFCIARGLGGLETLSGVPGWVGAAVYGNAGAYGHSLQERVREVLFTDGFDLRTFSSAQCEFLYRESIFKRHRQWIILSVTLDMNAADSAALRRVADDILRVRNEKFPPAMKCAGSIFKNLLLASLPPHVAAAVPPQVVREGKVPAAYFLEQTGAKGMTRGDIHVATYHANLLYNAGAGTAADLCGLIRELQHRVRTRFDLDLEEEVQYLGF